MSEGNPSKNGLARRLLRYLWVGLAAAAMILPATGVLAQDTTKKEENKSKGKTKPSKTNTPPKKSKSTAKGSNGGK